MGTAAPLGVAVHRQLTPFLPHGGLEQARGGEGKGAPRRGNGGCPGGTGLSKDQRAPGGQP